MNWVGREDRKNITGRRPVSLPRLRCLLTLLLLGLGGCLHTHHRVSRQLMAERGLTTDSASLAESYQVGCPDVLEVTVAGHPEWSGRAAVTVDGRLDLEALGRPRVEGRTTPAIAVLVAARLGVPTDQVKVQVVQYNSQQVYLFGAVNHRQQAVPYRGQETVLDLLQRTGGITRGAAPDDVYVIRPHLVEGTRPEVFHVDLRAIVLKGDESTNVRLRPFDQINVGETEEAKLDHCIPPWLRSLYRALFGKPEEEAQNASEDTTGSPPRR
jgi:protein involved in polysaccharide export with SLBB domain